MSSFEIFGARRKLHDLASAVFELVFYDVMNLILDAGEWQSYVDDVNGKTITFESMDQFLTHPDGLAITDLGLFQRCIRAVATSTAKVAQEATQLLTRLKKLGMSSVFAETQPLAQHGTNQHSEKEREDVITSPPQRGTTGQSYLLRRLARDAPDILERVRAGEFKSARAAAIEAGIIKPVPTIRLVADLNVVAAKLCQHLTPEQRHTLAEALLQ